MYTPTKRTVQSTKHEWVIDLPWGENGVTVRDLQDATRQAIDDAKALGISVSDDMLWVTANEEEIILYTTLEK
jgi:hypothetical protein